MKVKELKFVVTCYINDSDGWNPMVMERFKIHGEFSDPSKAVEAIIQKIEELGDTFSDRCCAMLTNYYDDDYVNDKPKTTEAHALYVSVYYYNSEYDADLRYKVKPKLVEVLE